MVRRCIKKLSKDLKRSLALTNLYLNHEGDMYSAAALRRRVRHEDVGGNKYDKIDSEESNDLQEPLLLRDDHHPHDYDEDEDEDEAEWMDQRWHSQLVWGQIFMRLLAQWVQYFAVFFGHGSTLLRTATRRSSEELANAPELTPTQKERLRMLQCRVEIPFEGSCLKHQEALKELWRKSFPGHQLDGLVSEQWKEMGWQGKDPSTDFRGGGFISLENLLFFSKEYPKSYQKLLHKEEGHRAAWEYPFAVAGINISFMLIQMLDLRSVKPKTKSGINFLKMLQEDDLAFDRLYCVAFEMMDAQWLAMRASYMEFNVVLKATQAQLERELSLDDVIRVHDLPAFNLLCH